MAWLFEGYELDSGRLAAAPAPAGEDRERFGLRWLDEAGLSALKSVSGDRSLYLLDVRTQAEFEDGHLPGSRWAEGGQLVVASRSVE